MKRVQVIGVGSPHGDDAIGIEVVRMLQRDFDNGERLEFGFADSGQRLLDFLDGSDLLILIDALKCLQARPGACHRLVWPDERIASLHPGSTHALGVQHALQLAAALEQLPKRIVIYAVEVADTAPGEALSGVVAAALPALVQTIRQEITSLVPGA